jgi:Uma2 family endonuclease
MSVEIAKRAFTVDEYSLMGEAGILTEDDRVELLRGEVIKISPIGSRHAACVKRLNTLLGRLVGQQFIVSVQDPIRLDDFSAPQPDVALLRSRDDFYAQAHPTAGDVVLIVEVADTSARYDREEKVPLYAEAGIPEVWLISLSEETIEIYFEPVGGAYRDTLRVSRGETFTSPSVLVLTLDVSRVLG